MSKPKLLLVTSKKIGDTGTVSFSYIFQDESMDLFKNYSAQCSGAFGIIKETDQEGTYYLNLFKGGSGCFLAAPLKIGDNEYNKKIATEDFPAAFNMLCTTEVAEAIKPLISEWVDVDIVISNQTLLTAK